MKIKMACIGLCALQINLRYLSNSSPLKLEFFLKRDKHIQLNRWKPIILKELRIYYLFFVILEKT